VVRSITNDLNLDYSALGHTTHLAARMQTLAAPGSVLLTANTAREVEGFVQLKSLDAVEIKGVSRPVNRFELTGATSARTRLQAAAGRGLTPFVGRTSEIGIFQRLAAQTAAGHGHVLAMMGEAGIGKSRLVHEFVHHHVPPDWLVLEGPSVSYGKTTPYLPVIEMLRRYFALAEGEIVETIQAKVVEQLLRLDAMLTDTIPPILTLLDALPDCEKNRPVVWPRCLEHHPEIVGAIGKFNNMEPQQRRRSTFDALKRIFMRESERQPLLLVFEDLHWIDHETQAFLDNLVDSLPMARILLLVNYRPGYSHGWADKSYHTRIRVDPLPSTRSDELLQYLLAEGRSCFESFIPFKILRSKIFILDSGAATAVTVTGPASGPLPASSRPIIRLIPSLYVEGSRSRQISY
jgi:hypothetical protein